MLPIHCLKIACSLLLFCCLLQPAFPTLRAQTSRNEAAQTSSPSPPPDTSDQITAVPNRPTFSTTAESVQPGVFEIEYGFELAAGHQNINGLLKFGATKNLELRFGNNPIERDSGVAGRGDSTRHSRRGCRSPGPLGGNSSKQGLWKAPFRFQ